MKTFGWLLKRELWENKGLFLWLPIILAALLTVFLGVSFISAFAKAVNMNAAAAPALQHEAATRIVMSHFMLLLSVPFATGVVIAFYCISALHSDRKNQSIWLWRSLPISDTAIVLSKVASAVIVAPLISMAAIAASFVILSVIMCLVGAFFDFDLFYDVIWNPITLRLPFQALALWVIYIFWAIPTVGWFLAVSAIVKRAPFVWAIALPLIAVAVITTINDLFKFNHGLVWVRDELILRAFTSTVPGASVYYLKSGLMDTLTATFIDNVITPGDQVLLMSWQSVFTTGYWVGFALGIMLIIIAIRACRWRE
jgi:ABC-2 type transport system permease protein